MRLPFLLLKKDLMSKQSENDFQSVNEIGRKELQGKIKDICCSCLSEPDRTLDYIGEDASSIYNELNDSYDLRTNSVFCEGVDFDLTYHPIKHLGYKLTVATASRILAMNGQTKDISVNVAVPNKVSVPILEDFYRGIVRFCNNYDTQITGFDIRAAQQFVVSINAFGSVDSDNISFRKGANVDDEMGTDVDKYALYGGEDFELLFTLPKNNVKELSESFGDITVIGKIEDTDGIIKMQTGEGEIIKFNT